MADSYIEKIQIGTGEAWPIAAEKLTSTLAISGGGTGATTADSACKNIGAVKKSGDTMTGRLGLKASDNYPTLQFLNSDGETKVLIQPNTSTGRINVISYAVDGTNFYENYQFPAQSTGLTANKYYDILTTKSPVTVAQGGTGAKTAAAARTNLAVPYKPVKLWAGSWTPRGSSITIATSGGTSGCTGLGNLSDYSLLVAVSSGGLPLLLFNNGTVVNGGGDGYVPDDGDYSYDLHGYVEGNTISSITCNYGSFGGTWGNSSISITQIYGLIKAADIITA